MSVILALEERRESEQIRNAMVSVSKDVGSVAVRRERVAMRGA